MRLAPIVPAALCFDSQGLPFSPEYGDIYHPSAGAAGQAQHVFLGGNGLPARWRGRERFVVLETGFGLGNNFLATWHAWREDPQRCERLFFISIEKHPFSTPELALAHRHSPWPELAAELLDTWPALTPDLHPLSLDAGRVRLLLAFGDAQAWLPRLVADVDAFYLDGFAPVKNPAMWGARVCKALARLANFGATLATWSAARIVRDSLRSAGFEVSAAAGFGAKRDMTLAEFRPAFTPRRAEARLAPRVGAPHHAVIVGAGLAGCAAAWALAQQGWSTLIVEANDDAALEASGNPAGTFHGTVNRQDGAHARFNRAAALDARRFIGYAVERAGVRGNARGLLRLETGFDELEVMQATLSALGLPPDYVRALDRAQASDLSGLSLTRPAWYYPGGGWVDPRGLARHFLDLAGPKVTLRRGTRVSSLRHCAQGWQLLDASGTLIDAAATLVLANAGDALRLLGKTDWPLRSVRGQISFLPLDDHATRPLLRVPITGSGFVIPGVDGQLQFGATAQMDDADGSIRFADHVENCRRLAQLCEFGPAPNPDRLSGRVGWRWSSDDRLPLIGSIPRELPNSGRQVQPRDLAREPGLFVFIGLGSRGITWASLGAQVLASRVTGAPAPIAADLIDAVDPARILARRNRRPNQPRPTTEGREANRVPVQANPLQS